MDFKQKLYDISIENKNRDAIIDGDSVIKYIELIEFYHSLEIILKDETTVGLLFEKSWEYLVSVFAISLSNTAFLPIENNQPIDRKNLIINDSGIKTIITSKKHANSISKISNNVKIIFFEDIFDINNKKITKVNLQCKKNERAYLIYTSGSTGKPKGVDISYNGLLNIIEQQIKIFRYNKSNMYLYLSISFDASLSDIYCAFLSASTIFVNDNVKKNVKELKNYFNKNNITHSDLPPSVLKLLSPSDFKTLSSIVIGGEVADFESVRRFAKKMHVVNVYGPTEATICTSYNICDESWNKPLIGEPVKNVNYVLLNDKYEIVKSTNQNCELGIQGMQLAKGYINNNELNKKHFILVDGIRTYLTGDIVKLNDDKKIEFVGRKDRQIKHRGQLINLEEVECSIKKIPDILNVSVIYKENKLYAFFEGDIEDNKIRKLLVNRLPNYMIPNFFVNKKLPKTITEKNDTKKLVSLNLCDIEEYTISEIFKKILKTKRKIGVNESFTSDLGGDSLDFMELHISLEEIGFDIDYDYLIEKNSIKDILNYNKKSDSIDIDFLVNEFTKIKFPKNLKKVERIKPKNILITGATGFLGTKLINEIYPMVDNIYCIVRGENDDVAKKRLVKALEDNKVNLKNLLKIKVYSGDLTKKNMGLNTSNYTYLSNKVDNVYHCAAEVNNIKNFNQLYNSNILSTMNVTNFLFDGVDKNMHYASTLSVFVSSNIIPKGKIKEEPLSIRNKILYSGYSQTKWLSEYYLNKINEKSNAIFIYRFGLLTNDTLTKNKPKFSFLDNFIKEIKEIGSVPVDDLNISMDITPIDIATKGFVDLSFNSLRNIHHITLNKKLYLSDFSKLLNLKAIPAKEWFSKNYNSICSQYMADINNYSSPKYNMNLFETSYIGKFGVTEFDIEYKDIEKYIKCDIIGLE